MPTTKMIKTKTVMLGLCASCLIAFNVSAQGLIGERYAQVSGAYEDFDIDGDSLDAWGGGFGVNVPLTGVDGQFGFDLRGGVSYAAASEGGVDIDVYGVGGGIRGYLPASQSITPYAEVGFGWARTELEVPQFGISDSDSTVTLPLGVGIEFQVEQLSLTPFFNYNVALESDYDDSWSIGATAAYWFSPTVGGSLTVAHTDYDDDIESQGISVGLILAF